MKNFKLVLVIVGLIILGGGIYKFTTASIKKPEVMMKKDLTVTETPEQEVMEKRMKVQILDISHIQKLCLIHHLTNVGYCIFTQPGVRLVK